MSRYHSRWLRSPLCGAAVVVSGGVLAGVALLVGHGGPAATPSTQVDSSPRTSRVVQEPVKPAQSPAETVSLLRLLHQRRDYNALAAYVVGEERDAMVDVLKAIDEVLSANAALLDAAQTAYSEELYEPFDLSAMADNLGPFSSRVSLISQSLKGDTAVVTFQEGENVPVVHAIFVWAEERWQYQPQTIPAHLPGDLRKLAGELGSLKSATQGGASFAAYCEVLDRRVLPLMARIVTGQDGPAAKTVAAGPIDGG